LLSLTVLSLITQYLDFNQIQTVTNSPSEAMFYTEFDVLNGVVRMSRSLWNETNGSAMQCNSMIFPLAPALIQKPQKREKNGLRT